MLTVEQIQKITSDPNYLLLNPAEQTVKLNEAINEERKKKASQPQVQVKKTAGTFAIEQDVITLKITVGETKSPITLFCPQCSTKGKPVTVQFEGALSYLLGKCGHHISLIIGKKE